MHYLLNCFAATVIVLSAQPVVESFSLESSIIIKNTQTATARRRPTYLSSSTKDGETEVERLLRKARELRAEAEAAEQDMHNSLLDKKDKEDGDTDRLIDTLFPKSSSSSSLDQVAARLRDKRLSIDTLTKMIKRLHERECSAKGYEYVKASVRLNNVKFERVKTNKDDAEAARLFQVISQLIDGMAVLDEEFLKKKVEKGEKYNTYLDTEHWDAGNCSKTLTSRIRALRRENDEQFKKRQEEYAESLKNKKDSEENLNLLS